MIVSGVNAYPRSFTTGRAMDTMSSLQNGLVIGDVCFYDGALKSIVKIISINNSLSRNVLVRHLDDSKLSWVFGYRLITLEQGLVEIEMMINDLQSLRFGIEQVQSQSNEQPDARN